MTSDCIINHWLLDIASASLIHQESGEQRRLGEYQMKLLVVLIQHAGQILSREELNQLVWERRVIGNNSLPNAIHALRVALEDDGKQQRIIKTVPKKGYILEAEFCHFQRRADADEEELDNQLLSITPPPNDMPAAAPPVIEEETLPPVEVVVPATAEKKPEPRRWIALFCLTLAIFIGVLAALWRSESQEKTHFEPRPLADASQIRLLELMHTPRGSSTNLQDVPQLLGETLRPLNAALQQRAVQLDIYYAATGTSLNLTLNFKSACAQQQLAMNIFNASENSAALSKLITTETGRKLDEMAPCNL